MLLTSLGAVAGCQVLAAGLDKLGPDPVQPALYIPQKDEMAIIVEDYRNPAALAQIGEHMDWVIADELIAFKVAPIINPSRLTTLRAADVDAYRKLKIPEIGRKLKARQVLYVDVSEFSTESATGGAAAQGRAHARVKIVDVQTGQTRWPRDATYAGAPIEVNVPFNVSDVEANDAKVRQALAEALAQRVAHLFHNVTVNDATDVPRYPETD